MFLTPSSQIPKALTCITYVRNIPTTKVDADGHCDWCNDVATAVAGTAYNFFSGFRSLSNAYHPVAKPGDLCSERRDRLHCQGAPERKTEYWGNSYGYDAWGSLTNKTEHQVRG